MPRSQGAASSEPRTSVRRASIARISRNGLTDESRRAHPPGASRANAFRTAIDSWTETSGRFGLLICERRAAVSLRATMREPLAAGDDQGLFGETGEQRPENEPPHPENGQAAENGCQKN